MNTQLISFLEEIKNTTAKKTQQFAIYKSCPYSASKIVEAVKYPFDKEAVAQKTFEKNFNNPDSEYYQMTVEQILEIWEKKAEVGRSNGRVLDSWIERILTPSSIKDNKLNEEYLSSLTSTQQNKCKQFLEFYHNNIENKLNLIGRELMLFDKDKKINGRLDALFSFTEDSIILIDWKNSQKITTSNSFGQMMRGPLYQYDSSDLNAYTVQLYMYVYMLRNKYHLSNYKIIPLIVRIGETDSEIYSPQIPYSDSLVEDIIDYAAEEINKTQLKNKEVDNEKNI